MLLPDGRSLNQELVRQGYAWWYRKYSKDERLAKLESEARAAKRGLRSAPNPTPPWDWRKAQKDKGKATSTEIVPSGITIAGLLPGRGNSG